MAASELPPIEVEIWARVGRSNQMYLLGTLEYPYQGTLEMNEFLRDFARRIFDEVEES